jgi:hypothetical protein
MRTTNRDQANASPPVIAPDLIVVNGRKEALERWRVRFRPSTAAIILTLVPTLAGCASHQLGPYRPVPIETDVARISSLAYPEDLAAFASTWPDKAAARNEMVTARMYVADMEYQVYEANLTKEIQDEGLLGTATLLGLTTASTLVSPAPTKTILSGLATGVAGLDKAYNEKELLSNAMQALQTQMRADRKAQAAEIYAKMLRGTGNAKQPTPIGEYTWSMALADAEAYYQAGTISSGLIGLSRTVSNKETNASLAKAEAGPNPSAVAAAHDTAAPISGSTLPPPVTIPQSRKVFVAPIKSAQERAPAPIKLIRSNTDGEGLFEQTQSKETILYYQTTLCLPRNGNVLSLRQGLIDFFSKANAFDPDRVDHIKTNGLNQPDLDQMKTLLDNESKLTGNKNKCK